MHAATEVVTVDLPKSEVFDYLANEANLPGWAGNLAGGEDGGGQGRIEADSATGVVDLWLRPAGRAEWGILPVRVMNLTATTCVVCVTCFAAEGVSAAMFAWQLTALRRQLAGLPEAVERALVRA